MWKKLSLKLGLKNSWNYRENKPLVITNFILVAMALFASLPRYFPPSPDLSNSIPKAPSLERPPAGSLVERIQGQIKKNMTLSDVLTAHDIPRELIHQLVVTTQPIYNLRKLIPGNHFELERLADGTLQMFRYDVDMDKYLKVYKTEEGYKAELQRFKYEIRQEMIQGTVHGSLFRTINELGEGDQLALDLSEIFSWDIDFNTELQENDRFRFVVEKEYMEGRFAKYGNILAADFFNKAKQYSGYYFVDPSGHADYYSPDGRSLKRDFLKSPIKFSRISSRFSRRRFHPILKSYRPHLGVDYAAPVGTPVVSAGNGRVQFAGWRGGFGRFVQISHGSELTTMYGHLSRLAEGIRGGASVKQGQVIGYVGATGLATGPHLDYRVTRHGGFVNPLSIKVQPSNPIRPEYLTAFRACQEKWQMQLTAGTVAPLQQQAAVQPAH